MTVLITGLGVATPAGLELDGFYDRLLSGRSCFAPITTFDPSPFRSQVVAQVDWDPRRAGLTAQEATHDRAAQLALYCVRRAVRDAGGLVGHRRRVGVVLGTAVGMTQTLEAQYRKGSDDGRRDVLVPGDVDARTHVALSPASMLEVVAAELDAGGPTFTVSTGCTSGVDSVAQGCDLIRYGRADTVVVVSTDAPISPITVACFDAIRATSPDNDRPDSACRPFDDTRRGFVLAEGATAVVLERDGLRSASSAEPYAVITGWSTRSNAFHMTGLRPDGAEMARAITDVLDQAGRDPRSVSYVSAHGSGTKQNDIHETAAVKSALGDHAHSVPMSSIKSVIGHSLGAIGTTEIAACCLAITTGSVPPTANLVVPDPLCDLDYVAGTGRRHPTDVALTVASGFGGFQSAMLIEAL